MTLLQMTGSVCIDVLFPKASHSLLPFTRQFVSLDSICVSNTTQFLCLSCFFCSPALQISAVRLPREPSNPERLKGFGYAEFDDVESLLSALSLSEEVRGIIYKDIFIWVNPLML